MRAPHALALVACAIGVAPAVAHIELDEPLVRHDNGDNGDSASGEINKSGPCGRGGASDVRNEGRVTTLAAGSSFTVRWRETIGHTGRMRIAFSADGDTQADFDANVLVDIADPSGSEGNIGDGRHWESTITLPRPPCENCTLQVIQAMTGNTTADVGTPSPGNTYFQCADLTLLAEGEPLPPLPDGSGGAEGCASTSSASPWTLLGLLTLLSRARRPRTR